MRLFFLSVVWMAGVFAARYLGWRFWQWCLMGLLAGIAATWLRRKTRVAWILLLITLLSLGGARYALTISTPGPSDLAYYNGFELKPEDLVQVTLQKVDARKDIVRVYIG